MALNNDENPVNYEVFETCIKHCNLRGFETSKSLEETSKSLEETSKSLEPRKLRCFDHFRYVFNKFETYFKTHKTP